MSTVSEELPAIQYQHPGRSSSSKGDMQESDLEGIVLLVDSVNGMSLGM